MDRPIADNDLLAEAPTSWHLCWQAAMGRELFVEPLLYARVRERLIDAHRRPGLALVTYLLMPTEIHVVSEIGPGSTTGDVARAVGNIVARWVREVQPVRSPVFAGPFRAYRIASDDELRDELRMLSWRPVFAGLCTTPSHHRHGALRIALGLTRSQGFDARWILRVFGDPVPQARAAMRAWIAKRPAEREVRQWELARGLAWAAGTVGPEATLAREVRCAAAAALVAAGGPAGVDGALRLLEAWVVARLGARGPVDLHQSADAVGARGRGLVACLAVDHGLCPAASVARHFHRAKATLSEQMTACRSRPADQPILRTPVARIIEEAVALPSPAR